MSIAYWKFIKIILPEFGGKDKRKKQKKSGNMGFKEFPRPLKHKNGGSQEEIFKAANSRLGWYRRCGMSVVNFIISKDLLENRIKDGAGLLNPLSHYLVKVGI